MLTDVLDELAFDVMPGLFGDVGTEHVQIVRDTTAINDYGGESASATTTSDDIPCVLYTKQGSRWILGEEYLDGRISMPAIVDGEAVDLKMTDKLKILERDGANPERLFSVKDIQNVHGVYLDVGVVVES